MANWKAVQKYVSGSYILADQSDSMMKLIFDLGDDRSQVVFIWHVRSKRGDEWIQVESPIGPASGADLMAILRESEGDICGALGLSGETLTVRHAASLENLDANEIDEPLRLVAFTADLLEEKFFGVDRF